MRDLLIWKWTNAYRNLLRQLSRDGHLHGTGMSHATTASSKPSFGAPLKVGDAIVSREKFWMDNIKEWTSLPTSELLTRAYLKKKEKKRLEQGLYGFVPRVSPTIQSVKELD